MLVEKSCQESWEWENDINAAWNLALAAGKKKKKKGLLKFVFKLRIDIF